MSKQASGRAWKLERASVHKKDRSRPQSNKYSRSDMTKAPPVGTRSGVWVGGYSRKDGTHVEGHYRAAP